MSIFHLQKAKVLLGNHLKIWKYSACSIKVFSKFYHGHLEFIVKYNIGLKTLLQQGISEPILYGYKMVICL